MKFLANPFGNLNIRLDVWRFQEWYRVFLSRLERMTVRISQNRLVDVLSLLLKGDVLEWFRTFMNRNSSVTSAAITNEMINRFKTRRNCDDIMRDLYNRKQNFMMFIRRLWNFSYRTTTFEMFEIKYASWNTFNIGHDLQNIKSINELIQRCVEVEDLWSKYGYISRTLFKYTQDDSRIRYK